MMNKIARILTGTELGSEECDELRAFARQYIWEGRVSDAEFAADHVVALILGDLDSDVAAWPRAVGVLRAALIASAERYETGIVGVCTYCGHPVPVEGGCLASLRR